VTIIVIAIVTLSVDQAIAAIAKCVLSLRPAMAARDGHELDSLHLCSLRAFLSPSGCVACG